MTDSVDTVTLASLAGALRSRMALQLRLGLRSYPATPALRRLLAGPQPGPSGPVPAAAVRNSLPTTAKTSAAGPVANDAGLEELRRDITTCTLCALAVDRQDLVFGRGTPSARLMFVGDCSRQGAGFAADRLFAADEDIMLWNMVRAIGQTPAEVYVTNTVKCCPPAGREPDEAAYRCCQAHLRREIELVQPHIVCAMGEAAARAVLGHGMPVHRLRGRLHVCGGDVGGLPGVRVAVTYHPRFLLAQPELKKAAWADLQMVQRHLQGAGHRGG